MKFHDELNPKLWDKIDDNYELKSEVADKLKEIADAFIEYLEVDEDAIKDVVITGSSASYNYTPHSDLDLHLKVDYDKVHEDCPIVQGYLWALKASFNKDHDISIYGVPVEVYAEPLDEDTVHNGLYSLWQGKWIDIPKKIPPTDNDSAVESKYKELAEAVDRIEDSEVAEELLDKIYSMRKAGLNEVGEFSTENLAFKKLRDNGYMDKLRQMKKEKIDKQLSLESFSGLNKKLNKLNEVVDKSNPFNVFGLPKEDDRDYAIHKVIQRSAKRRVCADNLELIAKGEYKPNEVVNIAYKLLKYADEFVSLGDIEKAIEKGYSIGQAEEIKDMIYTSLDESISEDNHNKSIFSKLDKLINEAMEETQNKKVNEDLESEQLDNLIYYIANRVTQLETVHNKIHKELTDAIEANDLSKIQDILAEGKSYKIANDIVVSLEKASALADSMEQFSLDENLKEKK